MYRESDPAAIPPNHLWLLVNGRLRGGGVIPRAGITEFNSVALQSATACVGWIGDYQISTPKKLWIGLDGCPGISTGTGFSLINIDMEQDPELQRSVYYNGALSGLALAVYGGQLHVAVDDELRQIELIGQPYGTENLSVSGSSQDLPLFSIAAGSIKCMQEFDGKLFVGVDNGAGSSYVAIWDGTTWFDTTPDLASINAPVCFAVHHVPNGGDALFLGLAGELRYRDTDGNWTTVSATGFDPNVMIPYKDSLYIANGDGDVWVWNNSTLSVANATASATDCRAVATFDGYLFYGYETASAAIIGRFDGSTWVDAHKNLTTQFTGATSVRALAEYRGHLVAGMVQSGFGRLAVSPGTATTGTYVLVTPNVNNNGDINFLLVA
jgi:hypothetical protein